METPSENNTPIEGQGEAGEKAASGPTADEAAVAGDGVTDDTESAPDPAEDEPEVATTSPGGLPEYKCHKVVTALLIIAAESLSNGRIRLTGVDPMHAIIVDADYVDKHRPQIGGYYVRYHDGYQSWSPAAAFEAGYTLVD